MGRSRLTCTLLESESCSSSFPTRIVRSRRVEADLWSFRSFPLSGCLTYFLPSSSTSCSLNLCSLLLFPLQHEILATIAKGTTVILCSSLPLSRSPFSLFALLFPLLTPLPFPFPSMYLTGGHTNTERGFLSHTLKAQLESELAASEDASTSGPWEVIVSKEDKEPWVFA